MFPQQNRLVSAFIFSTLFISTRVIKMWDLRKNYTAHRQDPIPLQMYPYPGSCMRMRLGWFWTMHIFLQYSNYQNPLTVFFHVLQGIPDLSWTPRDPTSSVTALMTISTCSMSVALKQLQVKQDSNSGLTRCHVHLCQGGHFPVQR